jgi:hypothetical protein
MFLFLTHVNQAFPTFNGMLFPINYFCHKECHSLRLTYEIKIFDNKKDELNYRKFDVLDFFAIVCI